MTIKARVYRKVNMPNSDLRAYGEVVLDQVMVIKVRVIEGERGLFVAFPSHKDWLGEYHDTAFPISNKFRMKIEKLVLQAYELCR